LGIGTLYAGLDKSARPLNYPSEAEVNTDEAPMNDQLLQKLAVTLDSETARQIAEQYIRWKYVDTFCGYSMGMLLLCLLFYAIYRMSKSL
jgi:hypothetical protein